MLLDIIREPTSKVSEPQKNMQTRTVYVLLGEKMKNKKGTGQDQTGVLNLH